MGNCASARPKSHTSEGDTISALAAQDQEVHRLRKQLEASTAYAQGLSRESWTLRERVRELENQHRAPSEDDRIDRPIVELERAEDAIAIRQCLYEFLLWEKDEAHEKCYHLEGQKSQIEGEVAVLRMRLERREGRYAALERESEKETAGLREVLSAKDAELIVREQRVKALVQERDEVRSQLKGFDIDVSRWRCQQIGNVGESIHWQTDAVSVG